MGPVSERARMRSKDYESFLHSRCRKQWKRLGLYRRAGVNVPLFSIYSSKTLGIGEFEDLEILGDWCVAAGMSLIQLLPMNDMGFDFRPYDGQSSFALDPMHLRLESLSGVNLRPYQPRIEELRVRFPCQPPRVNYEIKRHKLSLLRDIFHGAAASLPKDFSSFCSEQRYWLDDYALFRVLKDENETSWEVWPDAWKNRDPEVLKGLRNSREDEILFYQWAQWECHNQFRKTKASLLKKGIYLMGDLPFLVARDSADVWAHSNYFKLDRISGAPPDTYMASGQRWGMPAYRWEAIESDGYRYLKEKLRYAQRFYDLFRIDHVVGLFRLWTIAQEEPLTSGGRNGAFDPADESLWEEHGRKIMAIMTEECDMLPCAEDLGVVPPCSYKVLEEFAIPGMEVQRWARRWEQDGSFRDPEDYRKNAISLISTHDMPIFQAWWRHEAGTVDGGFFDNLCAMHGLEAERVRDHLLEETGYGRWRWKPWIGGPEQLPEALGRQAHEVKAFADLFRNSKNEKEQFLAFAHLSDKADSIRELVRRALLRAAESSSVFCIQLIHDWLALGNFFDEDSWNARINFPGIVSPENWSWVCPLSLEELLKQGLNREILKINRKADRI